MKKIAYASLLLPSILFGNSDNIDSLEKAIKESNVELVSHHLQAIPISENDLLWLIDLAKQIIDQRKSNWEIFCRTGAITPEVLAEEDPMEKRKKNVTFWSYTFAGASICGMMSTTTIADIVIKMGKTWDDRQYQKFLDKWRNPLILYTVSLLGLWVISYIKIATNTEANVKNDEAVRIARWKIIKKYYDDAIKIRNLLMKSINKKPQVLTA